MRRERNCLSFNITTQVFPTANLPDNRVQDSSANFGELSVYLGELREMLIPITESTNHVSTTSILHTRVTVISFRHYLVYCVT